MNAYKLNGIIGHVAREAIIKGLNISNADIYKKVRNITTEGHIITKEGDIYSLELIKKHKIMANWCSNWVTVEGEEQNVQSLMKEIHTLSEINEKTHLGVIPNEKEDLEYMFDIYIGGDNSFGFESKWSPANSSLQFLAKKHQVTITNQYSETGNMIFGQWYGDGEIEDSVWLTDEEWDLAVPGDEDGSFYIYDGKEYEVQEDALEDILDKKLQGLLH